MIKVKNLSIAFGEQVVVNDVTFSIEDNRILGLVGESGSGKSITALTIMGLLSEHATILHGSVEVDGTVIVSQDGENHDSRLNYVNSRELKKLQGKVMSMIFQEPMTSLNPTLKIGRQVEEILKIHTSMDADDRKKLVLETLESVGLTDAKRVYESYPHELSGGMRQRAMIAMAIILKPKILIADEPTTALDVTIQAQICELLKKISIENKMSVLFITHDLNLARQFCHQIIVMNQGDLVESGESEEIFARPVQEYTKKLIGAIPSRTKRKVAQVRTNDSSENLSALKVNESETVQAQSVLAQPLQAQSTQTPEKEENILEVQGLNVFYQEKNNHIFKKKARKQVVFDASFSIRPGEIMGLVGESGCGKSSLSKAILGMNDQIAGEIRHFSDRPQMIFQDPYSSLNPSKTIGWILEEPLRTAGGLSNSQLKEAAVAMLKKVGLDEHFYGRKPGELSGGQRQRISIGQALIARPKFVIADEPVSALDVTIQAQIMDLMCNLQQEMNLAYLFISHDINVIYQMCDRLMVMKEGRIIEAGETTQIFDDPHDPYTKMLLQ